MERNTQANHESSRQDERQQTHLFVMRVWKVQRGGRSEYRGSVRDVVSGAHRHFSDWSVAEQFVLEQVDEHERDSVAYPVGGVT